MKRQRAWVGAWCALFIAFSFLLPARGWAQDDDQNQYVDPPSRVARLNYAQGTVSFQPGGEGDWVDAIPNRPISSGDNLWTDRGSRAELHVGSTSIRLGSETSVTFLDLDDRTLQLRVAQGTTMLRLVHVDDDDLVEIDTPNVAFEVNRPGEFRVDVRPDGLTTIVDVLRGRGQVVGGGNRYTVVAGQQAVFTGDQNVSYDIDSLPRPDDFDRWASDCDRREDQSQSANYVSAEMTGYEDLDDNGSWSYAGGYGPVWYPTAIPAGWAPYRFGHWIWVAPWGWTWVDDARWGFAPFHYGRWAVIGGRWGWVPGPVAVHPVYAPALVAFVGGGFNVGGGGVAWFPLGPGEVFVPAYHVSRMYVTQVNVTNTVVNVTRVTDVYNHYTTNNMAAINRVTYMNQTAPNAVTAVTRETFVGARPVARNVVAVEPREIAQARVTHVVGVQPERPSVIGTGRPTSVVPPAAVVNRQVVAQHMPAQPPTPFAQREDKLVARPVMVRPVAAPTSNARQQQPGFAQEMNREQPAQPAPRQPVRIEMQGPPPQQQPQPTRAPVPSRPAEPVQQPQQQRPQQQQPPQPQQQSGWSHPLARPAPPVQEKTEQQTKQDEEKYQKWQQKQQQKPAAPAKTPPPSSSKH